MERHSREINQNQEILAHREQRLQQLDQTLQKLTSQVPLTALAPTPVNTVALAPANTTNCTSTAQSHPGQSVESGSKQGNSSDMPALPSEPGSQDATRQPGCHQAARMPHSRMPPAPVN